MIKNNSVICIESSDDDEMMDLAARRECIDKLCPVKKLNEENKEFKKIVNRMIGGINVSFPVEPYGCQVALMSKIIVAIKKKENCILESPTGSGKTLALLCGALAWQQTEKKRIEQLKNSNSASSTQKKSELNKDSTAGLVNIHKKFKAEESFFDEAMMGLEEMCVPTIYYGSRTHAQLKQVIDEFKRTPYCGKGMANMTILAARNKSCLRERDTAQWKSVDDMCRKCTKAKKDGNPLETYCSFYDNRKNLVAHMRKNFAAFDLEDLKAEGMQAGGCPYFSGREMMKNADIIFCPYNYFIDPNIRENLNISLRNNIVIIDEAHNIENICRDVSTFELKWELVNKAMKELQLMDKEPPGSYIYMLKEALVNWDHWFDNHSAQATNQEFLEKWQTEHFVESLRNHNILPEEFSAFEEGVTRLFQRYQDHPESLPSISEVSIEILRTLATALQYIFLHGTDYKPTMIDKQIVKLECLNPALAMGGLTQARCIALASGTLAPLESLHSELGTNFPHKVSLNHVVPPERVWIGALCNDDQGRELRCTAANIVDNATTLGRALLSVCRVTPHGVLVVLPSYGVLDKLRYRWRMRERVGYKSIWEEMSDLKHIFSEARNVSDHDEVMEAFVERATTGKGAMLFAIHRGKVSEGMDLKDRQARCVVCIGIPYANLGDAKAKKDYNNKYSQEKHLLTGDRWYEIQAYRALNQAVGRCVRHRADWGAVLLVDSRFARDRTRDNLPSWVQRYMDVQPHTPNTLVDDNDRSLKSFMKRMRLEDEE